MNKEKIIKISKEILPYILIIIFVLLLKSFIITPIRVNGASMDDTLKDKDIMILDKTKYRYSKIKRFDIVVVDIGTEKIIKRVIGLPGESIEYEHNILYVNGKRVEENFNHKKTADFSIEELGVKKIPKDMYLVMGDNRPNSLDSRIIGLIPKKEILGKTSLTIFPPNRLGIKE